MFKKTLLIGLLSVGAQNYCNEPQNHCNEPQKCCNEPQNHCNEPQKRHKISLWFKAIIPSIISYASLEAFIRANRDNADRQQLVNGAKHARWLPVIIGAYCLNIWMETDLKEWITRKEDPSTS